VSADCNACTAIECNPTTDGCCQITDPDDAALCKSFYACVQNSACSLAGDSLPCWCGSAPQFTACFVTPGAANGPCHAEAAAAAKTDDPAVIRERFVNPSYPIGRAVNLAACHGGFCPDQCMIP
jgi:hypothetical protein